jgi:uncharacterized protein YdaT
MSGGPGRLKRAAGGAMSTSKKSVTDSLKGLDKKAREKAIRIANVLLEIGLDREKAMAIAASRAKRSG